jgi:hypothetical protein
MAAVKDLMQRYLYTERLTLELFDEGPEHLECLLACVNNDTARLRIGDFGAHTQEDMLKFMRRAPLHGSMFAGGIADQSPTYMIREGYHDPQAPLVGAITLAQRIVGERALPPDIGWAVVEGRMGNGFATEAAREVLQSLRQGIAKDGVSVFASTTNWHSNHVAEKLGFVGGCTVPNADRSSNDFSVWILPDMEPLVFAEGEALSIKGQPSISERAA